MNEEAVGELLKRLLAQKDISQRKLSKISGVDRGYINALIKGRAGSISLRIAKLLAVALNEPPSIFLQSIEFSDYNDSKEKPEELIRHALILFPDTVPIYDPEDFYIRLSGPVEPSDFVYRRKYNEFKNVVGCYAFGSCLEPEIHNGDILIIDDNATPGVGDIAVCLIEDNLNTGRISLINDELYLVNNYGKVELSNCQRSWLVIETRRRLK